MQVPLPINARVRTRVQGTIVTSREQTYLGKTVEGTLVEQNEKIDEEIPQGAQFPAYVSVEGGLTKNMGDFNGIRVRVSISMPCAPDFESADVVYRQCAAFVEERVAWERDAAIASAAGHVVGGTAE